MELSSERKKFGGGGTVRLASFTSRNEGIAMRFRGVFSGLVEC